MSIGGLAFGLNTAIAGATQGLNRGLDDAENKRRFDLADKRAGETHAMAMEQGKNLLDEQAIKLKHSQFNEALDPALGAFVASDGMNYEPLRDVIKTQFPGGEGFDMIPDKTGKFIMKFTDGRESPPLDAQHIVGLAAQARDPAAFGAAMLKAQEYRAKAEAEAQAKKDQFNHEQPIKEAAQKKKDDAAMERTKAAASGRIAAAQTPRSILTPADDGSYALVGASGARPVAGTGPADRDPAATLTFTKSAKGGKGGEATSKMLADIDAIAADPKRLPVIEGEDPAVRWMRASAERSKMIGKDNPEAAVRAFEAALTAKIMGDPMVQNDPVALENAQKLIKETVTNFRASYGEGAPKPGSDFLEILGEE